MNYADMDNIGGNMTTLLCTLSLYRPVLRRDLPFHHLQEEECEFFDLQGIIISARCVCACVCPQLILHTSRLISLIFFSQLLLNTQGLPVGAMIHNFMKNLFY